MEGHSSQTAGGTAPTQPAQPAFPVEDALVQLQQELHAMAVRQAEAETRFAETCQLLSQQLALLVPNQSERPLTPPAPRTTSSKAKVATPSDYDGDRTRGRAFLNSCNIYFRLCESQFENQQARILWALSYMKHGRAAKWADAIFRWEERNPGSDRFMDWEDFADEFRTQFFPVDSEASAVNVLESAGYYQKSRNVDDYLDEFRNLIADSGYSDPKVIVVKFRRGLNPSIQNAIATMVTGRPVDIDYEGWYNAARRIDQARAANEAFQATSRSEPPKPKLPTIRPFPTSLPPGPPPSTSRSNPSPGNPVPMEIDVSRKTAPAPPVCFRCHKPGHIKTECPLRFDVRHMSIEEKEDMIQQLLAEKDAAEAATQAEEREDFR
jgi:hypothetical protein